MEDLKLSEEQWQVIMPLLPPQPRTGRRRKHDRQVLNNLVYRLKTGVRYRDMPKGEDYAAKSTVYHWLSKWSAEGVLERIWRQLLAELEAKGEIDLSRGSLDGSFVPTKRGRSSRPQPTRRRLGLDAGERGSRLTRLLFTQCGEHLRITTCA